MSAFDIGGAIRSDVVSRGFAINNDAISGVGPFDTSGGLPSVTFTLSLENQTYPGTNYVSVIPYESDDNTFANATPVDVNKTVASFTNTNGMPEYPAGSASYQLATSWVPTKRYAFVGVISTTNNPAYPFTAVAYQKALRVTADADQGQTP